MRNSKHHDKLLNTHKAKGATRQLRKEFVLIYLVISLVLIGLHALPPVNQLNNYLYDQFIQLNPISSSNDIIVIRIDDHAIDELGWPISREHYYHQPRPRSSPAPRLPQPASQELKAHHPNLNCSEHQSHQIDSLHQPQRRTP